MLCYIYYNMSFNTIFGADKMKKARILRHFLVTLLLCVLFLGMSVSADAASGWVAENGALYYYTLSGQKLTGEQTVDNTVYTFLPDGRLTGSNLLVETPGGTYCINGTSFVTGFKAFGSTLHYFAPDGVRLENGDAKGLTVKDGAVCGHGIYVQNASVRYFLENDSVSFTVSDYDAQLVLAAAETVQNGQSAVTLSLKNNPIISDLSVALTYDTEQFSVAFVYNGSLLEGFSATETTDGVLLSWEDVADCSNDGVLVTLYLTASSARADHLIKAECVAAADIANTEKQLKPAGTLLHVGCRHTFGAYAYNDDATCLADGTKTASCTACGEKQTVAAVGTKLSHTGGKATCVCRAVCDNCDNAYGGYDPLVHENLSPVDGLAPTCFKNGYTDHHRCTDCGTEVGKDVLPATNHKNAQILSAKAPTCTEDGYSQHMYCPDCLTVSGKEVYKATGHRHTETVASAAPTCTQDGWETYTYCTDCSTALDKVVLPATNHADKQFVPGKPATCEEPGFGDYYRCPDCESDIGYEYLPAINHENSYTVPEKAATCGADGWSEYVLCPDCGLTVGKKVYPSTGHMNIVAVEERFATCTTDGHNAHTMCTDCGTAFEKTVYPATGHIGIVTVLGKDATCTTDGWNNHTRCLDCNTEFGKETYPALNHANTVPVDAAEPTCTEDGYNDHLLCLDCGRAFGKVTTPKLDHPGGFMVAEVPATCNTDGVTAFFFCPVCQIEEGKQVLPALRHKNATAYKEVPATCTEDGMTAYLDCPDCKLTIGKQVIPKLDHKNMMQVPAKPGTCLEQGYTEHLYCPDCQLTIGKQPTPTTDHLYTNWAVFEAPALGVAGKEFHLCMICGHAEYKDLAALTLADGKLVPLGDIDMDGSVSASDARKALRIAVGLEEKTDQAVMLADYDQDGTVSASDARTILRVAVGLQESDEKNRYFVTESGHIEPFIVSENKE